ncbi:MAG: thioredoxin domain-containing protein [Acidobacteriota bacterium]|nr:thioredoxin domain-containing protein [Acidobacteriota bacterium]
MHSNRLIQEKSPYLQQHAHNPVDWYPWGEEAFERARAEDKPIFLSIGYSTCHWCHVMEHESFENEEIAALVNRWFVPIKVDREERPDIDRIYMNYVQATTGGGGWPMSVWLTPDLKPFVGGTYFPPDNRYGRAGFPVILERIAQAWRDDRQKILTTSAGMMDQLQAQAAASGGGSDRMDVTLLDSAFNQFRRAFDSRLGGFGSAPKFPRPSVHNFLLRYWKRTGREEARDMVVETLIAMEKGGMNDQLGGGFHRYSVDEYWFVPHFEKMLYDQAQLVVSYLEAFQITQEPVLAKAARRTLDYVMRDMTAPEGGFYSAEDADSAPDPSRPAEKSEGAFYIWSFGEVVELLGEEGARWFGWRYGMEPEGNVQNDPHHEFTGRNILFQAHTVEETARHFEKTADEIAAALEEAERILFGTRGKRPRPHLDDKVLTSWNGLTISAFARGGAILDVPRYLEAARRAADFLLRTMVRQDGTVLRRFRDGDAAIAGMLDDYAFFAHGLLDLYEATGEFRWLAAALSITRRQRELLEAPEGGFYASAHEDAARLMRLKDDYDGAEPSGNSIALMNLLRLHRITGLAEFESSARKLLAAVQDKAAAAPSAMPQLLAACEFEIAPQREIVIAGEASGGMIRMLHAQFDPNRILLYAGEEVARWQPAIGAMDARADRTTVYVCEGFTCRQPVTREEDLAALLR